MRITGPGFSTTFVVRDGRVARASPLLAYMKGWKVERVVALGRRRGWTITQQPEATCASLDRTASRPPPSSTTAK
jgi:hypothetical protein